MANIALSVVLIDQSQDSLDRGFGIIRQNYERSARRGRFSFETVEDRIGLITPSLTLNDLSDCDLIIEAVFENLELKQNIFRELDKIAKDGAILASNTSALNLNEIAAVTSRPESVIGLHFFSPANVMKLLEIVQGQATSNEVIMTAMNFAKKIEKLPVLVGVGPGFVGNRMLWQLRDQAESLILEGALPHQVDKVLYDFGMAMGPFQMRDLSGLDLRWKKETSNGDSIGDLLCEAGRFGQKAKAGFYDYDNERNHFPSDRVEELVRQLADKKKIKRREIDDQEVIERCIYSMINEAARILSEGIAQRGSDIDVIWCHGYGWPKYRGGPIYYADSVGLKKIIERLEYYHKTTGNTLWEPAPVLLLCADEGRKLQEFAAR